MAKPMTKGQVVTHLSRTLSLPRRKVEAAFDELVKMAVHETKTKGTFVLPGFGKLRTASRHARIGRIPQTGASIRIAPRRTVKFRVAKAIRESILASKTHGSHLSDRHNGLKTLAELYARL